MSWSSVSLFWQEKPCPCAVESCCPTCASISMPVVISNSYAQTVSSIAYPNFQACDIYMWHCGGVIPQPHGTLGDTRHLLGLVSLGIWIEEFEQNREEINVYHLLSYYLLKHSRCQVPDIKHHMVTITNSSQPLCKQNNNNNVNPLSTLIPCTSNTCIIFTS